MIPALVGRVSFTGELGYEIWVRPEYQRALYDLLLAGGRDARARAIRHARACCRMRLEKSFGTWSREYRPIYGPYEAGLGRFVDLKKNDFIGRAAAARRKGDAAASCACRPSRSRRPTPTRSATSRSGMTARSSAG